MTGLESMHCLLRTTREGIWCSTLSVKVYKAVFILFFSHSFKVGTLYNCITTILHLVSVKTFHAETKACAEKTSSIPMCAEILLSYIYTQQFKRKHSSGTPGTVLMWTHPALYYRRCNNALNKVLVSIWLLRIILWLHNTGKKGFK